MEIQNLGQSGSDSLALDGNGKLVINANCVGGNIFLRGNWEVVNNGTSTITYDDNSLGIANILDDTGTSGVVLANDAITAAKIATDAFGAAELAPDAVNEIRDSMYQGTITEGYAADGVAPTHEQMMYMIWSALSEFAISSTTITTKQLDGSTTAMTFTTDDATNPTSRTRAT